MRIHLVDGTFELFRCFQPRLYPDYLALAGALSKGLWGVEGWGYKSAAALLDRYGSIEAIPDDAGEWTVSVRGAGNLAEALARRRQETLLLRALVQRRRCLWASWQPISRGTGPAGRSSPGSPKNSACPRCSTASLVCESRRTRPAR